MKPSTMSNPEGIQTPFRIGTRGSKLALWQAGWVRDQLQARGMDAELIPITTSGDRSTSPWLANAGGKGLFTKELEEALLEKRIDLAVHSLKDVPARLPGGLVLAATPERADARDGLLAAPGITSLNMLPHGARVGTSSPRRHAQLRRSRPDLTVLPLRGNLDTRIRKWRAGEYDALIVAMAGLQRLQFPGIQPLPLEPDVMLPAAGQGIVCIECRAGDLRSRARLAALHHNATGLAAAAERRLLRRLGVGCQSPFAAYAELILSRPGHSDEKKPGQIHLRARLDLDSIGLHAESQAPLPTSVIAGLAAWTTPLDSTAALADEDGLPTVPGLDAAHAAADQVTQKLVAQGIERYLSHPLK